MRDKNVYQVLNCVEFKFTVNLVSFFEDNGALYQLLQLRYHSLITRP